MKRIIFLILFYSFSISLFSQDINQLSKRGFYGKVEGSIIGLYSDSQLFAYEDINEKSDNRNDSADSFFWLYGPVMFELNYEFENGLELYFGTPFYDDFRDGLTLGMEYPFYDESILDISLSGGLSYVWEDPYLVGFKRKETELINSSFTINYEEILGTGLNLFFRVTNIAVDDDISGKRFRDLKRDGQINFQGVRYKFKISDKQSITAGLHFTNAEIDGESNSYNGKGTEITYCINTINYKFNATVISTKTEYDKIHPIYNTIRKDDILSIGGILTKYNLFNVENLYSRTGLSISYSDSNINFFDYKTILAGYSIGYEF